MKFALVDDIKTEAVKGAKGICPSCGSEMIARCGNFKINHWAHKGRRKCDPWWENETIWHRSWKNNYPIEWQEISLLDEKTGEKHIADIQANDGLVIEFQHSYINPEERFSREKFYKKMVWVVDGTRLKKDYPRFMKGKSDFITTNKPGIFKVDFPDECFPYAWLESSVPVVFDFGKLFESISGISNPMYCLFPKHENYYALIAEINRKTFIKTTLNGEWLSRTEEFLKQSKKTKLNRTFIQPIENTIRRKPSKYVLERGKWKKRRRF
ncbi:competence protein CoiA [Aquimarina spongiae]|uniref:Competence protein CoiA-like family protein n=1 Tax=Aquimarina spongiae TaxID=570521 RepID=A0A1M6B890_9FLAO|nr:competence protein CoiA family protein [Aquimarina spongiae]SHI44798.1 Competence protein CoiA-like family protein [Aquimarina spongiae]